MKTQIAAAALVAAYLSYYQAAVTSAPKAAPDSLTIVSLNLDRAVDADRIVGSLQSAGLLPAADLLLFQEVAVRGDGVDMGRAIAEKLGYAVAAVPSDNAAPNQGLTIASRFPLSDVRVIHLTRYALKFHSRIRFALTATAHTPRGDLRIWNVHLDTRINPPERLEQVMPVIVDARQSLGPGLIAGDFNTTDFHWMMNVMPLRHKRSQGAALRGAMEHAGFRSTFPDQQVTFPFLSQHLDWIFARDLRPMDSGVAPFPLSDHLAIWAQFSPNAAVD